MWFGLDGTGFLSCFIESKGLAERGGFEPPVELYDPTTV